MYLESEREIIVKKKIIKNFLKVVDKKKCQRYSIRVVRK